MSKRPRKNHKHLSGMQCPTCLSEEKFEIELRLPTREGQTVRLTAVLSDEGLVNPEDLPKNVEIKNQDDLSFYFVETGFCRCLDCGHTYEVWQTFEIAPVGRTGT